MQIKLGFWKNRCAWLFIFWVCLFIYFNFFFLCLLSWKINDKETEKTHQKRNPTETDWIPITSISFGWEFHKPKILVSVGQHLENRPKKNWHTPTWPILILHSHGFLLSLLGFPGPITTSFTFGVDRLPINPLLTWFIALGLFSPFLLAFCLI